MKVQDKYNKQIISQIYDIPIKTLKKTTQFGVENFGVYVDDKFCYKLTPSFKESTIAKKLIGQSFEHVVKVYDVKKTKYIYNENCKFMMYIIKEERLFNKPNMFKSLELATIMVDSERRMPYLVQVLNGLLELNTLGIIHNDIHVDNVMFDKNDNAKIIDFGIAKVCKKITPKAKILYSQ